MYYIIVIEKENLCLGFRYKIKTSLQNVHCKTVVIINGFFFQHILPILLKRIPISNYRSEKMVKKISS